MAQVEDVARRVRIDWELGDGPMGHVVRLLEANGVVVSRLHVGTRRVDAFSVDGELRPIVVLAADKDDAARSRFDAAHELGHLVMHAGEEPGDPALEQEANWFAAAFLLPSEEIRDELPSRVQWPTMVALRQRWGVSIAMLLLRARTLGVISNEAYRRNLVRMSSLGWHLSEPGDIGIAEQPVLLGKALALLGELGISRDDFADALFRADVARVDTQASGAGVGRLKRALVVKMDVGDDRHCRGADDFLQGSGGISGRAGHADDVRAGLFAAADLVDRRLGVLGRRVGHRLDADRRVPAHGDGADHDLPRHAPLYVSPGPDGHGSAYRGSRAKPQSSGPF